MPIDHFTKNEILESINRIDDLLLTKIFMPENIDNPFVWSAFIEVLICLRDLMHKTEKYSERIRFDDDIVKTKEIQDISDVIKYVRDAVCHIDSDKHYSEQGDTKASYNIMYTKGCIVKSGDFEQVSDYDDDVCFFFGSQKIYLRRHLLRAFNDAKAKLLPLIS